MIGFIEAFASLGYETCGDGEVEDGYQKIAIYALRDRPTHAAVQLTDGRWTSKLGDWEDIAHVTEHDVEGISDDSYGSVHTCMRRRTPWNTPR